MAQELYQVSEMSYCTKCYTSTVILQVLYYKVLYDKWHAKVPECLECSFYELVSFVWTFSFLMEATQ